MLLLDLQPFITYAMKIKNGVLYRRNPIMRRTIITPNLSTLQILPLLPQGREGHRQEKGLQKYHHPL
jgi:hypothetical protein